MKFKPHIASLNIASGIPQIWWSPELYGPLVIEVFFQKNGNYIKWLIRRIANSGELSIQFDY